ncbi:putative short-chain type dehydrogenase [Venustampulla echinocandica]|uniref:Putative short-chain type dehydrogenase n=1 Tax=Venustampulla echinocandica TaxID=2656787 RepID=A0A370TLU4_9HELO|nr:putative short-chain type dehydrogenase [Venustampulla echinocandica]RDL36477.1 putative short-chain type dehydrogenase [Venustampulla echinocandica]
MPPPRGTPNPLEGPGDYDMTPHVHNDTYPAISPLSTSIPLNKAIFIAGASRGLGLAMAISFARAGASHIAIGARSSLSAVKESLLLEASSASRPTPNILCLKLDITSQSSVSEAAAAVEREFGKLDIVIVNAGILGTPALIADSDPEVWWDTWNVNLRGSYLVSRAFLPLLLKGGDKTIIALSSVGAHVVRSQMSAYQITKLAVLRLMEFVSAEYGEQGVVAFSVHPGNIPTDIVGGMEGLSEDLKPIFVETPELSADTIVYLTREKQQWLGGRYVNCTWDMPELMAKKDEIVNGDKLKVKLDF